MADRTGRIRRPDGGFQHRRNDSLGAVRTGHTVLWLVIEAAMAYLLITGFAKRTDRGAAIAGAIVATESVVFAANGFRCPLTEMAESHGAKNGSVTDIYLPSWFAKRLPVIHVPLIALAIFLHSRALRVRHPFLELPPER